MKKIQGYELRTCLGFINCLRQKGCPALKDYFHEEQLKKAEHRAMYLKEMRQIQCSGQHPHTIQEKSQGTRERDLFFPDPNDAKKEKEKQTNKCLKKWFHLWTKLWKKGCNNKEAQSDPVDRSTSRVN